MGSVRAPAADGAGGLMFGGRYEIRALLGSGGMARVHLAYDTRLGRTVALKTLLPELARDPEARRRFAREARAAAGLNHPGIVTVHDQDEITTQDAVVPFLVMEHIEGRTLSELARDQAPMEIERAVRITCDILDALAHAHARGLVHRDVKPSNVLITTGERSRSPTSASRASCTPSPVSPAPAPPSAPPATWHPSSVRATPSTRAATCTRSPACSPNSSPEPCRSRAPHRWA